MIALLGSLLGFGTSFLPQVLDFFKQKQEHKNRLEELKLRGELQAAGVNLELQVLDKKAEIEETKAIYNYANPTSGFAAGLAASVRRGMGRKERDAREAGDFGLAVLLGDRA